MRRLVRIANSSCDTDMQNIPDSEAVKVVTVAGTEIEYSECGAGEPLLLVHAGVFADWFVPLAASPALDGFRIIRVRRAGYGSNAPASHLTVADHACHLAALAELLKVERVHAVGHSSGALIVLQLAADRPQLVHSLTLIEPAACGPFQAPAIAEIGQRFIGPAMAAFSAGDLPGAFDSFMRGVCGDDYRQVIEQSLGPRGYEQAIRESSFFSAMKWRLRWSGSSAQATRRGSAKNLFLSWKAEGGEILAY